MQISSFKGNGINPDLWWCNQVTNIIMTISGGGGGKTSRHLLKLSWESLEEIVFKLSDVMVQEEEKTDCEGFEPTVVNEVKFPETPTGSLVKSEGSQCYT